MKTMIKWLIFVLPVAVIGGFFTGIYTYEYFGEEFRQTVLTVIGSEEIFFVITTVQSVVYSVVATILGVLLSQKIGLLQPVAFEWKILKNVLIVTICCGILFAGDYFTFGQIIPQVAADYEKGISFAYFCASVSYGGVIEEVMLRLFFMSLVAFCIWKIFYRKKDKEKIPCGVFVFANIISAIIFAVGHIPATMTIFGEINFLIIVRCFLLNGGFGLLFGRFYRKYGIQYAFVGHIGVHVVSKLILIFAI